MIIDNIPVDAGYDNPNILDWEYKDVVPEDYGNSTADNRKLLLQRLTAYNQYTNPRTRSAC